MKKAATPGSGHFHAVRFYESSQALCTIVADFLGEGFGRGLPGIVIATPEHWTLVAEQLHARGFDVERLEKSGELIVADAGRQLSTFMVDGMPRADLFRAAMIPLVERACRGRTDCVVRAYGEMVDVLWKGGHTVAATKLEMLWNSLAQTHDFALLCGYSMGHFYKDAALKEICDQHTHLVSSSGEAAVVQ